MKRILIVLAAALFAAAMLSGCVSFEKGPRNSNIRVVVTYAPNSAPTPTPASNPIELVRGTIEGNVYTNESLQLSFTAPGGWVYSTDEEIGSVAGGASDGTSAYDMMAEETATNTSVMVAYQKLTAAELPCDEVSFIDMVKEQLESDPYFDFEFDEYPDTTIGRNTFKAFKMTYTDNGFSQYYFVHKQGDYMVSVLVTITNGSDIGSIMANFSAEGNTSAENISRGTVSGNVYSSGFSGITFAAPEGWDYTAEEDLAEMSGISADDFPKPGGGFSSTAQGYYSLYDMSVMDIISQTNVIIGYEDLSLCQEGAGISMEQYIDTVKGFAAAEGSELKDAADTNICGKTYKALTMATPEKQAVQYTYLRRVDKYMLIVTVSVFGDDKISDVMANFS